MTKPTLVQTILNQPSQTYRTPDAHPNAHIATRRQDYFSSKQEMMRIAAEARRAAAADDDDDDDDDTDDSEVDLAEYFTPGQTPRTSMASSSATFRRPSRRSLTADSMRDALSIPLPNGVPPAVPSTRTPSATPAVSRTPSTSAGVPATRTPSTSVPTRTPSTSTSSRTAATGQSASTSTVTRTPSTSSTPSATRAKHAVSASSSLSSTSLEAHSLLSDYSTRQGTATAKAQSQQRDAQDARATSTPASASASANWNSTSMSPADARHPPAGTSKSSSRSPPSAYPGSPASSPSPQSTNKKTTPESRSTANGTKITSSSPSTSNGTVLPPPNGTASISPPKKYASPRQPHTFSAFASISSQTATPPPAGATGSAGSPHNGTISPSAPYLGTGKSITSTSPPPASTTSTRVPPPSSKQTTPPKTGPPSRARSSGHQQPQQPQPQPQPKKPTMTKPGSALSAMGMGMDSLPEEEEDDLSVELDVSRRRPSDGETTPPGWDWGVKPFVEPTIGGVDKGKGKEQDGPARTRSLRHTSGHGARGSVGSASPSSASASGARHQGTTQTSRPSSSSSSSSPSVATTPRSSTTSPSTTPRAGRGPPRTLAAEAATRAAALAAAGQALPSHGTQGYSALILPRAPPPASFASMSASLASSSFSSLGSGGSTPRAYTQDASPPPLPPLPPAHSHRLAGLVPFSSSVNLDLAKAGLASETMASVEVVRGLGARYAAGGVLGRLGLGRRRTREGKSRGPVPVPLPMVNGEGNLAEIMQLDTPANTNTNMSANPSPLAFTAYRTPPKSVPRTGVLVQVWAVGLDGIDARLVGSGLRRARTRGVPEVGTRAADDEREGAGANGVNGRANGIFGGAITDEPDAEPEPEGLAMALAFAEQEEEERREAQRQRQGQRGDGSESDGDVDVDVEAEDDGEGDLDAVQSTPASGAYAAAPRRGPFASLGRSLSLGLRLGGGGGAKNGNAKTGLARAATSTGTGMSGTPPRPRTRADSLGIAGGMDARNAARRGMSGVDSAQSTPGRGSAPSARTHGKSFSMSASTGTGAHGAGNANGKGSGRPEISRPKRAFSLRRSGSAGAAGGSAGSHSDGAQGQEKARKDSAKGKAKKVKEPPVAEVGYIPGRAFVGRVLEVGYDVADEVAKRGEWVVGLLDVRKAGALTEYIVVDRHRVRRLPPPYAADAQGTPVWAVETPQMPSSPSGYPHSPTSQPMPPSTISLAELALLPLCALPAYRAIRTFVSAFAPRSMRPADALAYAEAPPSAGPLNSPEHVGGRRRALVLRGHDGAGALAVQLLASRGWRVSVHVPVAAVPALPPALDAHNAQLAGKANGNGNGHVNQNQRHHHTNSTVSAMTEPLDDSPMHRAEMRARVWGADEVVYDDGGTDAETAQDGVDGGQGAAVRVLATLREDGDVFDAVLDGIGGKAVWAAAEALLASPGGPPLGAMLSTEDAFAEAQAYPRRRGTGQFTTLLGHNPARVVPTARDNFRAGLRAMRMGSGSGAGSGSSGSVQSAARVGYAWVSVAQDVDWEGHDIAETLGAVVRLALAGVLRPPLDGLDADDGARSRVWPLERAPEAFVDDGPLVDGGTVVVRVA